MRNFKLLAGITCFSVLCSTALYGKKEDIPTTAAKSVPAKLKDDNKTAASASSQASTPKTKFIPRPAPEDLFKPGNVRWNYEISPAPTGDGVIWKAVFTLVDKDSGLMWSGVWGAEIEGYIPSQRPPQPQNPAVAVDSNDPLYMDSKQIYCNYIITSPLQFPFTYQFDVLQLSISKTKCTIAPGKLGFNYSE